MSCDCLPAISGISDGPSVDCLEHGESVPLMHNLTTIGKTTSGRFVFKGQLSGLWYWQDDMCEASGRDEGYPDMHSAFDAALEHAITCRHRNFNRR